MTSLPQGWAETIFAELFDFQGGSQPPKSEFVSEPKPGYIRLLQIRDFTSDDFAVYIPDSNRWPKCTREDIMIGRYGASVGKILSGKEGAYNVALVKLLFLRKYLNPGWVKFFLFSEHFQKPLTLFSRSAQNGFNKTELAPIPVWLPPLPEQNRIAEKIEDLQFRSSKARKALETIPPLLEKFRQSGLSSAFRGDLTADWRAQNPDIEPAEKLLERIRKERRKRWEENELAKMKAKGQTPKDDSWKKKYKEPEPVDTTDLPELPEGWCWASLEELSWNSSYGTSTKCDYDATGVPVLRIPNIEAGLVNQNDLKYSLADLSLQDEDYLAPCDFLIIRTNGSRNLIGRGALITDSFSELTFFASYLIRFRFVNDFNLCQWLSFVWHSPVVRNRIENLASTSAGQYNINMTKLNSIVFPIPPKEEIRKINFLLENALEKEVSLSTLSKSLSEGINKLNQSILAKAFRGELVPQDPNDEPASHLLERIKQEKASLEAGKKQKGKVGRKKLIRKKEATAMAKKKERRSLVEVLQPHAAGLSPEELFQEKGITYHGGSGK